MGDSLDINDYLAEQVVRLAEFKGHVLRAQWDDATEPGDRKLESWDEYFASWIKGAT